MRVTELFRFNALIFITLLTASCGLKAGGSVPNDTIPSDATLVSGGSFTSSYMGISSGGTAEVYFEASQNTYILQISGLNLPNEPGMQIFANGTIFISNLDFITGTKNYFVPTTTVGTWSLVSIHSTAKNVDYLHANLI